mgnify:CR=1 FL=1
MAKKKKTLYQQMSAPLYEAVESADFHWLLSPSVISADAGNGKVSVWRLVNGHLQHFMMPNARSRVTGYSLSKEVTADSDKVVYADFMGARYGVGEGIWEQTDNPVQTFSNSRDRYGSDYHIFQVLVAIALMGVETEEPLTLIISAPPGLVNEVAPLIKGHFLNGESGMRDGHWSIKLSAEKEARTYHIAKVIVVPEGAGSFAAYAFDANGNDAPVAHEGRGHDLLAGRVLVLDGGMGTFDSYIIQDGKLASQSIQHATDSNFGISRLLIQPVRDYVLNELRTKGKAPTSIYDPRIDSWLKQSTAGDDVKVTFSGVPLDLYWPLTSIKQQAADLVIAQKVAPLLPNVDTVLITGGLWTYLAGHLLSAYPNENILVPNMFEHTAKIPLWDLNAYGGLAMAANNMRVFKKVNS